MKFIYSTRGRQRPLSTPISAQLNSVSIYKVKGGTKRYKKNNGKKVEESARAISLVLGVKKRKVLGQFYITEPH